jgi:hypothetical protein
MVKKRFKIGDFVTENGCVGVITQEYSGTDLYDWEVAFLKMNTTGCYLDCCLDCKLKPYDWKPFPKTFIQKLMLLFNIK